MYKNYDQLGAQRDESRDVLDVLEIRNNEHKKEIIENNLICCIDIYADWCGPCKQTAPDYSLVSTRYSKSGLCAVVKYNFDKLEPFQKNQINGIPIFEFYFNKILVDKVIGADIGLVEEKLKGLLAKANNFTEKTNDNLQGPYQRNNSIRQNRPMNNSRTMNNIEPVPYNTSMDTSPYNTMNFNSYKS